jgi:hypothetical protein
MQQISLKTYHVKKKDVRGISSILFVKIEKGALFLGTDCMWAIYFPSIPKYPTYEQNQCRGEPYVRPPDKNRNQTYVRE